MFDGRFHCRYKGQQFTVPNLVVQEGEIAWAKMIAQGDDTIVAAGGNYFVGLSGNTAAVDPEAVLADITDEPTVANNYARKALARDGAGFGETVDLVNGQARIRSAEMTFSATPGNYDKAITRLFLCSVASGSSGTLFAFSAPLQVAIQITPSTPFVVRYELFMKS